MKIICNYSAGVTSTIATKLALDKYGKHNCRILFFETGQHHPDNKRFMRECEEYFGKSIEVFRNKKYANPIDVALKERYVNGPGGAKCTMVLKKKVRQKLQPYLDYDGQVFGFEYNKKEMNRAFRFMEQNEEALGIFPLIEARLTKQHCLEILKREGIEMPEMYKLGYHNNNCIGCFKGGQGYWNLVRKTHPEQFMATKAMEADVGASCIKGMFLKDLPEGAGRHSDLDFECGAFCDVEMEGLQIKEDLEVMRSEILGEELQRYL